MASVPVFCKCPVCGEEAEQASWEKALRTRFNGIKHRLSAKTAMYFPAKPDRTAIVTKGQA
ncbi:protein of unknown function [Georgfuchsia toluolica]|uniref:Uncharacterized protein n=1 Tax=Georgfuchsia toluolica TaxID=424218 RepID=A0A916N172_9PROT|nr:protein of unknown function [Georgfuchsia toluolica]